MMNRVLMLACASAATALVTVDANAAGRLRVRSGCGCSQSAPVPVYTAPQPAAPRFGNTIVPQTMPGMAMPAMPGMVTPAMPGMVTPAAPAPSGHQHSATPSDAAMVFVSTEKPVASCCGKGGSCCGKGKAALVSTDEPTDEPKATEKVADMADAKEVKLEGTLWCAKCGLKEAGVKKCTNAIQVKEGDKTVTYYLNDKGSGEDYHEGLCGGGKKEGAKVTGSVTEKEGKKWVKASKVEEKK